MHDVDWWRLGVGRLMVVVRRLAVVGGGGWLAVVGSWLAVVGSGWP